MNKEIEISKFSDYLANHSGSEGTKDTYLYALSTWFSALGGLEPTEERAQEYIDSLARTHASSTVGVAAHAIMRWFKFTKRPIDLDCPTIRMKTPEYLSIEQVELVLGACRTTLELAMLIILFDTAIRISELLNLKMSDIHLDTGTILVRRKGGRDEEVNISSKALDVLKHWIEVRPVDTPRVFGELSYYSAWKMIKEIGERVDVKIHPHIFRHSRAIQMLLNGADLHIVQDHLGHVNIATTANIYGRFKAIDLKDKIPAW